MTSITSPRPLSLQFFSSLAAVAGLGFTAQTVQATTVDLGTASSFAILAGSAVTFTGPMNTVVGDVGVWPGTSITGAPANLSLTGAIHNNDAVAQQAQSDVTTAYGAAAGAATTTVLNTTNNQLGGLTLVSGVYQFGHGDIANLVGTLTLDGQGAADALFIFQATSDFITASGSSISLINGADACNVFWQVSSSATLGSSSHFEGVILALTSITLDSGVAVNGHLFARNGLVSLINDTVISETCQPAEISAAGVPDGGSALLLLASGLMGLMGVRRAFGFRA